MHGKNSVFVRHFKAEMPVLDAILEAMLTGPEEMIDTCPLPWGEQIWNVGFIPVTHLSERSVDNLWHIGRYTVVVKKLI